MKTKQIEEAATHPNNCCCHECKDFWDNYYDGSVYYCDDVLRQALITSESIATESEIIAHENYN